MLLFGATGMIGQGVLRECLLDPDVNRVVAIGRARTGVVDAKLHEIVHADLLDFSPIQAELTSFDACFFCLGVSSVGMNERDYTRVTHDFAMAAARALLERSPQATFIFVSGAGADSTERGPTMWARVKGRTENDLLRLPFRAVYVFRPGGVQPLHGIRSKTAAYRAFYTLTAPLLPWLLRGFPQYVTTTERIGRAMIAVARRGGPSRVLESREINRVSG